MARARVPVAVAEATGAADKNPRRHRGRRAPGQVEGLGEPPEWFEFGGAPGAVAAWEAFRRELPWLRESHRVIVEMACVLRGRLIETGGMLELKEMQELRRICAQLGATPADESKVNMGDGGDEDPDEAFFSAPPAQPKTRAEAARKTPAARAQKAPAKPH